MADNELKEMFKTVLQGELKPIHEQLHELNHRMGGLETRFDGLEIRFDGLETRFDGLETRIDGLQHQMNYRFDQLEQSIEASDRDSINADEILLKHILELKEIVTGESYHARSSY